MNKIFTCERNYLQLSKGKKQEFTVQLCVTTRANISFTSTQKRYY